LKIVEKLCDRNATKNTFVLLENSIFMDKYFDLLVQTLISHFFQNENVSPEPILRQIINLHNSESNFMVITKRISMF
jgi:hypothetical protein